MNPGEIYYCSDQFGPKFIKIIRIEDMVSVSTMEGDDWVFFLSSPWLDNIVSEKECDRKQNKKWHFEKLINNLSYNNGFRGCIKVPDNVINWIVASIAFSRWPMEDLRENYKMNIDNIPYMEFNNNRILCKSISKEDYRNIKLDLIL